MLLGGVATLTDTAEPSAKASIVSVILSSCRLPRETRRSANGPRIVRRTSANTNTEPGSLRAIRRAATLLPFMRIAQPAQSTKLTYDPKS